MANAATVMEELFPPPVPDDAIIVYEGASNQWYDWAHGPNGGWSAWDMRGWLRQLTWDLLRFRPLTEASVDAPEDKPLGLWDAVLVNAKVNQRNSRILGRIADNLGVDISDL